ncbi:hypothetical protein [Tropicimonas sp. IMCC6043]|uniref:hypothetical protein n=1 Tax=Tropicimonas sp. IMCC6043 TaxID=2510645 RepID=UPI00101DCB1F|nr:hypothetical protein [Tropicimonas sp. IMCC6043]RYH08880.1 hypothetical protein EU800_14180 [Tropicimonas sp. IMCC6043]
MPGPDKEKPKQRPIEAFTEGVARAKIPDLIDLVEFLLFHRLHEIGVQSAQCRDSAGAIVDAVCVALCDTSVDLQANGVSAVIRGICICGDEQPLELWCSMALEIWSSCEKLVMESLQDNTDLEMELFALTEKGERTIENLGLSYAW